MSTTEQKRKQGALVVNPHHPNQVLWSLTLLAVVFVYAMELPLRTVFGYSLSGTILYLEILVTVVFFLDMLNNFRSAYFENGEWIHDPVQIRQRYFRGWFWPDLIAMLPLELIFFPQDPTVRLFLHLLRLSKLLHFGEFSLALQILARRFMVVPIMVRLMSSAVLIMIAMHWISCGWIFVTTGPNAAHPNPFSEYVNALYWAIATVATVGYGDITPENTTQKIFAICVMIFGVGMFGYVVGNIATLFAQRDSARLEHTDQMNRITSYLKYRKVPLATQQKIRDFFTLRFERGYGRHERELLDQLPPSLQTEVSMHLNREILETVPLFTNAEHDVIQALASKLKPNLHRPGDIVIRAGDIAHHMYFISRGSVEIFIGESESPVATLEEGAFFGEMALLSDRPRSATVKAAEYSDIYSLAKEDFEQVLARFPDFAHEIHRQAERRQKHNERK